MTGMGSVAGDFCSHMKMGSPKVYVICRVVKMHRQPALSPATSVTSETRIPGDMCPLPGKHISLVICVPSPRKHISL